MKPLSYLLLFLLSVVTWGCAEEDHPYVGYITIDRAVVESTAGASATVTANTDISSPISVEVTGDGAEWCTASVNGKDITVTTTQANPDADFRVATVNVKCGYRVAEMTVLQKYEGQEYLQYDWSTWSVKGSDFQDGDGGGFDALLTENRGDFWHSQYNPATPNPHWLLIDMKEELSVDMFRIARRGYGATNYPSVKVMEIYTSTDNENFAKVGGFTFALPWTAPDGTVVTGNSQLVPPYEDVILSAPVTARYVKLVITETNNSSGGACQIGYFKAMQKI